MKILFISVSEENVDPLSIELLSALAKREGHSTFFNVLEHRNLQQELKKIYPDVVAYSAKTGESNVFLQLNKWIRSEYGEKIIFIMGGPHPTFNHARMRLSGEATDMLKQNAQDNTLHLEETELDYLAIGEADQSWPALLRALDQKESADGIPGILTSRNRLPNRSIAISNRNNLLDDLPFYDRELVYSKTQLKYFGMRTFMASRGCPYPCTYCFNAKYNDLYRGKGKTINRYSVDRLLEELLHLKKSYPTQFIKFWDDIFVFRVDDWLLEFADKYPRVVGLPFHCLTRADLVRKDPSIINVLRRAGLHSITMSIESGNPFIRKYIFKRGMEQEDIQFAFRHCQELGVRTFSNNILAIPAPIIPHDSDTDFEAKSLALLSHLERQFNLKCDDILEKFRDAPSLPVETREWVTNRFKGLGLRHNPSEYDLETIDINIQNKVTSAEFVQLSPYPGTALTQYSIDVGAFDGDFEKLSKSFQSESPFTCFTAQEKRQQLNLSFIGPVLLLFPWLRNSLFNRVGSKSGARLFFLIYFLVRGYILGARIYPMHYSLHQLFNKLRTSFTRELNRHFENHEGGFGLKSNARLSAPSDILGGPWKN